MKRMGSIQWTVASAPQWFPFVLAAVDACLILLVWAVFKKTD
ncbi:hypothetical protein [Paenibacillus sp. sgz5001063]